MISSEVWFLREDVEWLTSEFDNDHVLNVAVNKKE